MSALDLLRAFVARDGPAREVSLDDDDGQVTLATAALIQRKKSPPSTTSSLDLKPGGPGVGPRQATAVAKAEMLQLLHQCRQDDIGSSLFQVLSELNAELQLWAGTEGEWLTYGGFCALRERVSARLRQWLSAKVFLNVLHLNL